MSLWTCQVHKERKAKEKLSAAEELEKVETGSELEIGHGVELEALASHTGRVSRRVDFNWGDLCS